MAEWTDSTAGFDDAQPGLERAKAILTEFACAAQSAAVSLANEQKHRAAQQVDRLAHATRSAARSLERSESPAAAHVVDRVGEQIESLSHALRERRWGELIGDLEEVARRRPLLFIAAAIAVGFISGRFLSISGEPYRSNLRRASAPRDTVTAAISSASGNGTLTGWTDPGSEPRAAP
jgi:hypothetical protein